MSNEFPDLFFVVLLHILCIDCAVGRQIVSAIQTRKICPEFQPHNFENNTRTLFFFEQKSKVSSLLLMCQYRRRELSPWNLKKARLQSAKKISKRSLNFHGH